MTFEQFQATRAWADDLSKVINDSALDEAPPVAGYVYLDCLYIEKVQASWPEVAREAGGWYLLLNNAEFVGDLTDLERKLYEFAVSEDYCTQGAKIGAVT